MFRCKHDTNGDGDCSRCVNLDGCPERPREIRVVDILLDDLWGRAGFDEYWCEIQADVRQEIRDTLAKKVKAALDG